MKTYLAVFVGTKESRKKSGWDEMPESERKARAQKGIKAWGEWMQAHAGDLVYPGAPLGKTTLVSKTGVSETSNALGGFVVIKGESKEVVAKKFLNHPHFTIFPGDGVEIMECLPIPGQ